MAYQTHSLLILYWKAGEIWQPECSAGGWWENVHFPAGTANLWSHQQGTHPRTRCVQARGTLGSEVPFGLCSPVLSL